MSRSTDSGLHRSRLEQLWRPLRQRLLYLLLPAHGLPKSTLLLTHRVGLIEVLGEINFHGILLVLGATGPMPGRSGEDQCWMVMTAA